MSVFCDDFALFWGKGKFICLFLLYMLAAHSPKSTFSLDDKIFGGQSCIASIRDCSTRAARAEFRRKLQNLNKSKIRKQGIRENIYIEKNEIQ